MRLLFFFFGLFWFIVKCQLRASIHNLHSSVKRKTSVAILDKKGMGVLPRVVNIFEQRFTETGIRVFWFQWGFKFGVGAFIGTNKTEDEKSVENMLLGIKKEQGIEVVGMFYHEPSVKWGEVELANLSQDVNNMYHVIGELWSEQVVMDCLADLDVVQFCECLFCGRWMFMGPDGSNCDVLNLFVGKASSSFTNCTHV